MSPHKSARSTWRSTAWLLVLLCLSLLGWRLSTRMAQYRPAVAGHSASAVFFDANEGNIAAIDDAGSPSRTGNEDCDRLFRAVCLEPVVWPIRRFQRDTSPALPLLGVQPVSLFSNPPPASIA